MIAVKAVNLPQGSELIKFFEKLGFRNSYRHLGGYIGYYYTVEIVNPNILLLLTLPPGFTEITFLEVFI